MLEGAIQLADSPLITYDLVKDYFNQPGTQVAETLIKAENEDLTISAVEKQMIESYLEKYKYNKTRSRQSPGNVSPHPVPPFEGIQSLITNHDLSPVVEP